MLTQCGEMFTSMGLGWIMLFLVQGYPNLSYCREYKNENGKWNKGQVPRNPAFHLGRFQNRFSVSSLSVSSIHFRCSFQSLSANSGTAPPTCHSRFLQNRFRFAIHKYPSFYVILPMQFERMLSNMVRNKLVRKGVSWLTFWVWLTFCTQHIGIIWN
jgi:hypothetical protein